MSRFGNRAPQHRARRFPHPGERNGNILFLLRKRSAHRPLPMSTPTSTPASISPPATNRNRPLASAPADVRLPIDDTRIREIMELAPPSHLLREFPASERAANTTFEARQAIHRILHGADDQLLVVVGPCSIHD